MAISGLKINYSKSLLMGCNVTNDELVRLAALLDVEVGTLPIHYLGAPLGGNPKKRAFWSPVLERLRIKLQSWDSRFLSLAGRLTLLKSVLSAIPVFTMSVFLAPVGVVGDIEKLMRAFLWGNCSGVKKINWISWEQICKNSKLGGLGLGFLGWRNRALLLKWLWRFGNEKQALWRRVICVKYKRNDRCMILHTQTEGITRLSPILQDILKVVMEDTLIAKAFRDACFCGLGTGQHIRFWRDPWVDLTPLHIQFPRLFALAEDKNALVCSNGAFANGTWSWNIAFRRQFFGWETDVLAAMYGSINRVIPSREEDRLIWTGDVSGLFSVKGVLNLAESGLRNSNMVYSNQSA